MNWLKRRWAEPESRAAAAAALGALSAAITGRIDLEAMLLAVFTAALAFCFPSTGSAR